MHLYILVEGEETEMKFYPRLFELFLPAYKRIYRPEKAEHAPKDERLYYLMSGQGQPHIYRHACNAIRDINEGAAFSHLLVCIDAEECSPRKRRQAFMRYLHDHNTKLHSDCTLHLVVQTPCIESWFLANRKIFPQRPQNPDFIRYVNFYNVKKRDPEKIPNIDRNRFRTRAQFHLDYLQKMLAEWRRPREIRYSKSRPTFVLSDEYLTEIYRRVLDSPDQLAELRKLFDLLKTLA